MCSFLWYLYKNFAGESYTSIVIEFKDQKRNIISFRRVSISHNFSIRKNILTKALNLDVSLNLHHPKFQTISRSYLNFAWAIRLSQGQGFLYEVTIRHFVLKFDDGRKVSDGDCESNLLFWCLLQSSLTIVVIFDNYSHQIM